MSEDEDMNFKPHCIGTKGFRAPEATMMDDYSEKSDIFSVGVMLFVMLTNEMPFRRVVCKNIHKYLAKYTYTLDPLYQLFCEKNNTYWIKNVRMSPNINHSAKQLIYSMVHSNPDHRISLKQIKNDQFYNTDFIPDDQLKQHIQTFITQLQSRNSHDDMYNQKNNSSQSISSLQLPGLITNSISTKPIAAFYDNSNKSISQQQNQLTIKEIPFWINENDTFYYTTTHYKPLLEVFYLYIKTVLNGCCRFYKQSQTLHCHTTVPFEVEFGITVYKSHEWNYWRNVWQSKSNEQTQISTIYTISINILKGIANHFYFIIRKMMQHPQIQKVVTGIPQILRTLKSTYTNDSISQILSDSTTNEKVSNFSRVAIAFVFCPFLWPDLYLSI